MKRWRIQLTMCLWLGWSAAWASSPKIVVSIAPLHALTQALMQDVASPQLLLSALSSPHHAELKPSTLTQLQQADLVVWVGPALEHANQKPIQRLPAAHVMTLMEYPELRWRKVRHTDSVDPHLWLDPMRMRILAELLVKRLIVLDPAHAEIYTRNLKQVQQQLQKLDKDLVRQLTGIKSLRYWVYHDAYGYFEERYRLPAPNILNRWPERPLSPQALLQLQREIANEPGLCVWLEPQHPQPSLQQLLTKQQAHVIAVDTLSISSSGITGYAAMMQTLVAAVQACRF